MPRVANPGAERHVDLGQCDCPPRAEGGQPHDHDEAWIAESQGYGFLTAVAEAGSLPDGTWSNFRMKLRMLELSVKRWNLLTPAGEPLEVSPASMRLLDEATVEALAEAIDATYQREPLPNSAGARSATSSPASASPDPITATPTTASSTTS